MVDPCFALVKVRLPDFYLQRSIAGIFIFGTANQGHCSTMSDLILLEAAIRHVSLGIRQPILSCSPPAPTTMQCVFGPLCQCRPW
jgi:hypothetical protein